MIIHENLNNLEHPPLRTEVNIAEDKALLMAGVLDKASFEEGYKAKANPVEFVHADPSGKLISIRRTHNLRTNSGSQAQARNMFLGSSTGLATFMALSAVATQPLTTDNTTQFAEITASGLGRVQLSPGYTANSVSANTSQAQTVNFTNQFRNNSGNSGIVIQRVGIFDSSTSSAGNLWFVSVAPQPVTLNISDTLTVTYRVDF